MPCIRRVKEEDCKRIHEIYSYYVLNTAISFDLSVPDEKEFKEKTAHISAKHPYLVIEDEGEIRGYAYADFLKERDAYAHSCEVSIYVDKDYRKKGYGRALYEALEKELTEKGLYNLYACIGDPIGEDEYLNNDSEKFHSRMGYKKVGVFSKCGKKFNHFYNVIWKEKISKEPSDLNDYS